MSPIELTQKVDVKATLMVVPEYGEARPATPDDLIAAGWIERESMYDRWTEVLTRVGIDTEGEMGASVQSLIEYASGYYDWEIGDELAESFAVLVDLVNAANHG